MTVEPETSTLSAFIINAINQLRFVDVTMRLAKKGKGQRVQHSRFPGTVSDQLTKCVFDTESRFR